MCFYSAHSGVDTPTNLDTWFQVNILYCTHENTNQPAHLREVHNRKVTQAHTVPVPERTMTLAYGLSDSVVLIEAGIFTDCKEGGGEK